MPNRSPTCVLALQDIKLPKHSINLQLQGVGTFRNGTVPGSIWVGVKADDSLQGLFQEISDILLLQGFAVDNRRFLPHVTLGRIKKVLISNNIDELKSKYQNVFLGKAHITEFTYYQSILTPQGPVYKPIQKLFVIVYFEFPFNMVRNVLANI